MNFGEFYGSSRYGNPRSREDKKYCYYKVKMEGKFEETCEEVPTGTVEVYPFHGQTTPTGTGLSCSFGLKDVKVLETCRCAPAGTINCHEYVDEDGMFFGDSFINIFEPGFPRQYKFKWCATYQLESCLDPFDCEGTKFTTIDEIKLGPFGGDEGSCRSPSGAASMYLAQHGVPVWLGTADISKCENRLIIALGDYWEKNIKCPIREDKII